MKTTGHKLLDKQIKRASRFTVDEACDYDLLFKSVARAYSEKEELAERYSKANKVMTREIAESKTFLDLILSNIREGVFGIDPEGKVVFMNKAAQSKLKLQPDEIIGSLFCELFYLSYEGGTPYSLENCKILRTIEKREPISSETDSFCCKDGSYFPAAYSSVPIINDRGEVLGAVVTFQDISERKRIEEERKNYEQNLEKQVAEKTANLNRTISALERARDEANRSSKAKSDFLANMSHELRTPLNSIIGIITMLSEQEVDGEQQEMLSIVQRASQMLLETVDDLLDLSKIENEALVLETIPFDFSRAVVEVVDALAPLASKKGLSLNCTMDKGLTFQVYGDPLRVKRILNNLIGNAIKYTLEGGVDVSVTFEEDLENDVQIVCHIKDSGVGIAKEKLEYVFEKFTQADETTTRKFGGTGLGLAITKELIDMMGGRIFVESDIGKGSDFSFSIPFKRIESFSSGESGTDREHAANRERTVGEKRVLVNEARILMAEDHELNQIFMKKFMASLGVSSLVVAKNGAEVLEFYKNGVFDLIFMDCHMPEIDGYEATEAIRKIEEGSGKYTPIVAMTADAMLGTREKCFEHGMDDYVSKPINKNVVIEVLSRWIDFSEDGVDTGNVFDQEEGEESDLLPVKLSILDDYADTDEEKKKLIDIYFVQSSESMQVLKENCIDGKNEEWSDAAHKFKGGSAMLGAKKLSTLCKQAEDMLDATAEERVEVFAKIEAAYAELKEYLEANI